MRCIALLFGWFVLAVPALSQVSARPIVIGESHSIESQVLNETRQVYIGVPQSYGTGAERYGVLYVLDGESHLHHTLGSTRFLGGFPNELIPPLLVVAIGTTNRLRDLTPPSDTQDNAFVVQGGADKFLQFIEAELKPWVDETYRTNGYNVLIGHSLGGLFGMYTFISRPDSFDSYLLIDPSMNWNDQELVRQAEALLNSDPALNASLYLSASSVDDPGLEGMRESVRILEAIETEGLRWAYRPIAGESHGTVAVPGTYLGLQWIFSDWKVSEEAVFSDLPGEQILAEIDQLYRSSGERFGVERETPYFAFESLLGYLASNDRLDEAVALSLRQSERFPLMPNVVAGIAGVYASDGNYEAAIEFLLQVLELIPDDSTATRILAELRAESDVE